MNIPQANENVTDRNREQTKRICHLIGWTHVTGKDRSYALLPNGSFTLDQVVGMLEAEHITWCGEYGWCLAGNFPPISRPSTDPHDLTAAMDALIKVLEEKNALEPFTDKEKKV